MDWMLMPFRRFADFRGRSRRKEYWMFALLNLIVFAVLFAIVFSTSFDVGTLAEQQATNPLAAYSIFYSGTGVLLGLWWLVVLIPTVAVNVRRLHDRDWSGWWYLGFIVITFVPIVGFLAAIAYLVFMCLDGTPGPNRFGPDPKNRGSAEVFS